jgi:hypothetical protein
VLDWRAHVIDEYLGHSDPGFKLRTDTLPSDQYQDQRSSR